MVEFACSERKLDHQQMSKYISSVHRDDDGYITIASRTPYGVYRQRHCQGMEEILQAVQETYSTKSDIFVSVNSFYLPLRSTRTLRRINAIYVDIDFLPLSTGDPYEKIYWPIQLDLVTPGLLPPPSMVIDSGHGMHLYWLIEDVPGLYGHGFWQVVAGNLASTLKRGLTRYEGMIKVDAAVSSDAQRVMRLPGTYNQRTGRMCQIVIDHTEDIYRLDELRDKYGFANNKQFKKVTTSVGNEFYARLMSDLVRLRDMRRHAHKDLWCRRRMTFMFRHFALLSGLENEKALEMTIEFNSGFSMPMPETKMRNHTYSAQKAFDGGKAYRYKIVTLIDELSITSDEMSSLDLLIDDITRQQRRRARRRALYGQRDENGCTAKQREMSDARAHVAYLIGQGKTQSEISRITGFSLSKIKRLRAEMKNTLPEAAQETNKILENEAEKSGSDLRSLYVCALTPHRPTQSTRLVRGSEFVVEEYARLVQRPPPRAEEETTAAS